VDLAALMEVLDFTDGKVPTLWPVPGPGGMRYPVPAEDFDLTRAEVREDDPAVLTTPGPQVVLCTEGSVVLASSDGELALQKGRSAFLPAGAPVTARGDAVLYRATTNL
jgi:mannose-6-phosphate isomerase